MGRPALATPTTVRAAVKRLEDEGKDVTINAVQALVGGSKSTVSRLLVQMDFSTRSAPAGPTPTQTLLEALDSHEFQSVNHLVRTASSIPVVTDFILGMLRDRPITVPDKVLHAVAVLSMTSEHTPGAWEILDKIPGLVYATRLEHRYPPR